MLRRNVVHLLNSMNSNTADLNLAQSPSTHGMFDRAAAGTISNISRRGLPCRSSCRGVSRTGLDRRSKGSEEDHTGCAPCPTLAADDDTYGRDSTAILGSDKRFPLEHGSGFPYCPRFTPPGLSRNLSRHDNAEYLTLRPSSRSFGTGKRTAQVRSERKRIGNEAQTIG